MPDFADVSDIPKWMYIIIIVPVIISLWRKLFKLAFVTLVVVALAVVYVDKTEFATFLWIVALSMAMLFG